EKQRLGLKSVGEGNGRGGSANVADEAENVLFLVKLLHGFCRPGRLVAIVACYEPQLSAVDPAGVVDQIERRFDPNLHLFPELLGWAGKRRRESDRNSLIAH